MNIDFKCTKKEFPKIDMFIHSQEYNSRPEVDTLLLDVEGDWYLYHITEEHSKYYFTTVI